MLLTWSVAPALANKPNESFNTGLEICMGKPTGTRAVKTGFTLEITLRKSRVERGWDLASVMLGPR